MALPDIDNLYQSLNETSDSYQCLSSDIELQHALQQWPLLNAISQKMSEICADQALSSSIENRLN